MTKLYKNKFRIASTRLQNWNYSNEAMYFVTICTKNRANFFGEIVDGCLKPTELGKIAYSEWFRAIEIRPDMNLELGEFVVMPNHIHGIIMIGKNDYNSGLAGSSGSFGSSDSSDSIESSGSSGSSGSPGTNCRDAMPCVSTIGPVYKNQFAPQSKNLSSIIRGYKSAVTTFARKNGIEFDWQPLFHEHIIRSQDAFHRISNYIANNPLNWDGDKFYPINR